MLEPLYKGFFQDVVVPILLLLFLMALFILFAPLAVYITVWWFKLWGVII